MQYVFYLIFDNRLEVDEMKRALIVGMAKSGIAAAKLLANDGWEVLVNDQKKEIPGLKEALEGVPVRYCLGQEPEMLFEGVSLMVISPVIPMTRPFVRKAQESGIEVIGEIELGFRYAKADFVCITGTNGKTTCTTLTGEFFKMGYHAGRTYVLGNIGIPVCEYAAETRPGDVIVAETAALQLEGNASFHAREAAVCNITEDHLDHFGNMENYIAAKCRIFERQTAQDVAVLNYDDPEVRAMYLLTPARILYFSRKAEVPEGMFVRDGRVILRMDGAEQDVIGTGEIRIPGGHNLENAMLSALLAVAYGIELDVIRTVLRTFPGVEHRIEFVRELDGVQYINDSKGTNPASTIRAIEAMTRPTVLILGGYDKHLDFTELFQAFGDRIRAVIVLGQTKEQILETARKTGYASICTPADTFEETVELARRAARPGDTVLLSPACASWGMFENYEQRGRIFKEIVNAF